jgi:hypothetical protein
MQLFTNEQFADFNSARLGIRALDRRIGGDGVGGADLRSMSDDNLRRNSNGNGEDCLRRAGLSQLRGWP